MTDPVLDISGLTVRFGGVLAVDSVDFTVQPGEILGLVGPNGAGKTTIFDALCGFVAAKGVVRLAGRDISSLSPEARSRARLGRSFQDAKMFPSLTVSEALAVAFERHIRSHDVISSALSLPWVRRAEKKVAKRVDELIGLMGLDAFRDKFISELSTGSRRIVDLAAIIAHDPVVLLLDEPSSGIAQREAEALGPLLLKIRKETDTTMLVVEHDMPLLRSISDQILALETGRVLAQGDPETVLADPRLIAAYMGTDQAVVDRSGAQHHNRPVPGAAPADEPAVSAARRTPPRAGAATRSRPAATPRTTAAPTTTRAKTARSPRAKTPTKKAAAGKAAPKAVAKVQSNVAATNVTSSPPKGVKDSRAAATPRARTAAPLVAVQSRRAPLAPPTAIKSNRPAAATPSVVKPKPAKPRAPRRAASEAS